MFKGVHDKTTDFLKDSIKESYTETAFELQKGMGKGFKMEVPYDEHKLENILRTPWASDGKNFSSRIWKRKDKLVNELKKNLSEAVIRGDSDTEAIKALSIDADKAEFNTRRIIETESAFFDSESERQCCEDFGIEKYRYLAVLDLKTSDICQELDNKVFLEKERQIGVNAPPMHPFCRSTTAPVVDEEFLTSRRAKNIKTGEYDEIPADMNYKEWKAKYVDGKENAEEVKQEQVKVDTPNGYEIKLKNKNADNQYFDTPLESKTSEFDSNVYENRVKKQAEKNNALIERIENNKDIPKELAEDIKANIRENEKLNDETLKLFRKDGKVNQGELRELFFNYPTESCAVNWDYIKLDSYKEDFNNLSSNDLLNKNVHKIALKILEHRDNTKFEDVYILDMNGNILSENITENRINRCSFSEEQEKMALDLLKENKPFIVIHNHPNGGPPSPWDYNHIFDKLYQFGIVIGHNGTIYKYYPSQRRIDEEKIEKEINERTIEYISRDYTYNMIYKNYNLNFKRIYKNV